MSMTQAKSSVPDSSTLRREKPTLYRELKTRLELDGNSWNDLESVVLLEDQGNVRHLPPDGAIKELSRAKFTRSLRYKKSKYPNFFAYTSHRIYYTSNDRKTGKRVVTSIPRNPHQVSREDLGVSFNRYSDRGFDYLD